MLPIRRDAGRDQVGPTQPLKFRRGLPVIQAGIVTAFAADELEPVGVTVYLSVPGDAGRLAAQDHRPAKRGLGLGRVSTARRGSAHLPPGKVQPVKGYLLVHMSCSMRDYWPFAITLPGVTRSGLHPPKEFASASAAISRLMATASRPSKPNVRATVNRPKTPTVCAKQRPAFTTAATPG